MKVKQKSITIQHDKNNYNLNEYTSLLQKIYDTHYNYKIRNIIYIKVKKIF